MFGHTKSIRGQLSFDYPPNNFQWANSKTNRHLPIRILKHIDCICLDSNLTCHSSLSKRFVWDCKHLRIGKNLPNKPNKSDLLCNICSSQWESGSKNTWLNFPDSDPNHRERSSSFHHIWYNFWFSVRVWVRKNSLDSKSILYCISSTYYNLEIAYN